jgi:hypothetical protein
MKKLNTVNFSLKLQEFLLFLSLDLV